MAVQKTLSLCWCQEFRLPVGQTLHIQLAAQESARDKWGTEKERVREGDGDSVFSNGIPLCVLKSNSSSSEIVAVLESIKPEQDWLKKSQDASKGYLLVGQLVPLFSFLVVFSGLSWAAIKLIPLKHLNCCHLSYAREQRLLVLLSCALFPYYISFISPSPIPLSWNYFLIKNDKIADAFMRHGKRICGKMCKNVSEEIFI